jgi:biotin carboxylase
MKALVTNCTRNSGLTIMRALAESGWCVHGADNRRFSLGLRTRFAAGPYLQLPPEREAAFLPDLLSLIERLRPDVLIPARGTEQAVHARDALFARTACLLPPPGSFAILNDKSRLLELCPRFGIAAPEVLDPDQARQRLQAAGGDRVVIKPRCDAGGGRGVHIISDPNAVDITCQRVAAAHGGVLISDFIPGPVDNLRAVHLLFDVASRPIAYFVMRKLRIWPARVGVSVAAVTTHETELLDGLVPMLRQLNWQGPVDAEFKIDARDGKPKILEINPRFFGAVHFPIASGLNLPLLYCRAALGEQLPEAGKPAYAAGLYYRETRRWLRALAVEMCGAGPQRWSRLRRAWHMELGRPCVPSVNRLSDPAPMLGKLLLRGGDD